MRLLALCLTLCLLTTCDNDLPPGASRVHLDQQLHSYASTTHRPYWTVADSAAWEQTLAMADTIHVDGNYHKLRSGGIWYDYYVDGDIIKAYQHFPGFDRKMDSLTTDQALFYMDAWTPMLADIPTADVELNGDSVRISIVHFTGPAFSYDQLHREEPDYLFLNLVGRDSLPLTLNQRHHNIGPITKRTIFRVGRHKYALRSLSDDRREMVIEEVVSPRDLPLTAEINLQFRKVPVNNLAGKPIFLTHKPGKKLYLFFIALHPGSKKYLLGLKDFFQSLPPQHRDKMDVALIFPNTTPEDVTAFLEPIDLGIATYLANSKTCLQLHCRAYYPYYIEVDERGRFRKFWGRPDDLSALAAEHSK